MIRVVKGLWMIVDFRVVRVKMLGEALVVQKSMEGRVTG